MYLALYTEWGDGPLACGAHSLHFGTRETPERGMGRVYTTVPNSRSEGGWLGRLIRFQANFLNYPGIVVRSTPYNRDHLNPPAALVFLQGPSFQIPCARRGANLPGMIP